MTNDGVLTTKEKEIIALSASIASGCRPCTEYHVNGAHAAGACDRSVTLAIETALAVRDSATRNMMNWASRCQSVRPELDESFRDQKRMVRALAAVAAAAAVNSVPDLKEQWDAARQAGATPEQIRAAVAIAGSVRRTAEEKVRDALTAAPEAAASCCSPQGAGTQAPGSAKPASCGCR